MITSDPLTVPQWQETQKIKAPSSWGFRSVQGRTDTPCHRMTPAKEKNHEGDTASYRVPVWGVGVPRTVVK